MEPSPEESDDEENEEHEGEPRAVRR
jgi:hypothetical protein